MTEYHEPLFFTVEEWAQRKRDGTLPLRTSLRRMVVTGEDN